MKQINVKYWFNLIQHTTRKLKVNSRGTKHEHYDQITNDIREQRKHANFPGRLSDYGQSLSNIG